MTSSTIRADSRPCFAQSSRPSLSALLLSFPILSAFFLRVWRGQGALKLVLYTLQLFATEREREREDGSWRVCIFVQTSKIPPRDIPTDQLFNYNNWKYIKFTLNLLWGRKNYRGNVNKSVNVVQLKTTLELFFKAWSKITLFWYL